VIDEVNQEESEQDEVDGTKNGAIMFSRSKRRLQNRP